jgi:hypothetical protein
MTRFMFLKGFRRMHRLKRRFVNRLRIRRINRIGFWSVNRPRSPHVMLRLAPVLFQKMHVTHVLPESG